MILRHIEIRSSHVDRKFQSFRLWSGNKQRPAHSANLLWGCHQCKVSQAALPTKKTTMKDGQRNPGIRPLWSRTSFGAVVPRISFPLRQ